MRILMGLGIYALTAMAFILSCGKTELNYAGDKPVTNTPTQPPQSRLHNVAVRTGKLELVPNTVGIGGTLDYTIYGDGMIRYQGDVSFYGRENPQDDYWSNSMRYYRYSVGRFFSGILTVPFEGSFKAVAKTVESKSYRQTSETISETKMLFKTVDFSDPAKALVSLRFDPKYSKPYPYAGSPTDYDATGTAVVDLSEDVVDIVRVDMTGRVYGETVSVTLIKR